jgi:hypothetical protein
MGKTAIPFPINPRRKLTLRRRANGTALHIVRERLVKLGSVARHTRVRIDLSRLFIGTSGLKIFMKTSMIASDTKERGEKKAAMFRASLIRRRGVFLTRDIQGLCAVGARDNILNPCAGAAGRSNKLENPAGTVAS